MLLKKLFEPLNISALQKFCSKTNTCFVYPLHLFRSQIRVFDFAIVEFEASNYKTDDQSFNFMVTRWIEKQIVYAFIK